MHVCVPVGSSNGHSHPTSAYPNKIDPAGDWADASSTITQSNGIPCKMFTKDFQAGTHTLYHTTAYGWGYVYIVQLK